MDHLNSDLEQLTTNSESDHKLTWLRNVPSNDANELQIDNLVSWVKVDNKADTIENETNFCAENILKSLIEMEETLGTLTDQQLDSCRRRSNPYEGTERLGFVCRSAIKLAEMDYQCDWLFTKPYDKSKNPLINENDLMYVADIGGGPGGFVDYILWRKRWQAKCFGVMPKNECNYRPNYFRGENHSFLTLFPTNSSNGDITKRETQLTFCKFLEEHTPRNEVDVVMADAALSIQLARRSKEIISKRLHLCNCLMALTVLRKDGIFVLKLFDTFTTFTVGLIYLMYLCFYEIAIFKPKSSRPSSAERYLICKYKQVDTKDLEQHFVCLNKVYDDLTDDDITEVVPLDVIKGDQKFYKYIIDSNNIITAQRIEAMKMVLKYNSLMEVEPRQAEFRQIHMKLWNLTEPTEKLIFVQSIDELFNKLISPWLEVKTLLNADDKLLTNMENPTKIFSNKNSWYFVPVANGHSTKNRTFFLSKGGFQTFMFDRTENKWIDVPDMCLTLPSQTLVYGEIFEEFTNRNNPKLAFRIIDGLILGGIDIRSESFLKRSSRCQKFTISISNNLRTADTRSGKRMRIAHVHSQMKYSCFELNNFVKKFEKRLRRVMDKEEIVCFDDPKSDCFYVPEGFLLFNSKSTDAKEMLINRFIWKWSTGSAKENKLKADNGMLDLDALINCFKNVKKLN